MSEDMHDSIMCPPLPDVPPHPEAMEAVADLKAGRIAVAEFYGRLRRIMASYLWGGASLKHGDLIAGRVYARTNHYPDWPGIFRWSAEKWNMLRNEPPTEAAADRGVMTFIGTLYFHHYPEYGEAFGQVSRYCRDLKVLPERPLV